MTEEILKRIDAVAAKLGVAAGEVWRIWVREGALSWIAPTLVISFFLIGTILTWRYHQRHFQVESHHEHGYGRTRDWSEWTDKTMVRFVLSVVISLVTVIIILSNGHTIVMSIWNPEALAIEQLRGILK